MLNLSKIWFANTKVRNSVKLLHGTDRKDPVKYELKFENVLTKLSTEKKMQNRPASITSKQQSIRTPSIRIIWTKYDRNLPFFL